MFKITIYNNLGHQVEQFECEDLLPEKVIIESPQVFKKVESASLDNNYIKYARFFFFNGKKGCYTFGYNIYTVEIVK